MIRRIWALVSSGIALATKVLRERTNRVVIPGKTAAVPEENVAVVAGNEDATAWSMLDDFLHSVLPSRHHHVLEINEQIDEAGILFAVGIVRKRGPQQHRRLRSIEYALLV